VIGLEFHPTDDANQWALLLPLYNLGSTRVTYLVDGSSLH